MLEISNANDYIIERELTTIKEEDGSEIVATGLTGGIGFISATKGGDAIHASLQGNLEERSGKPGSYYCVIQGDAIGTHLEAYDGQFVWECVQFSTDYKAYARVKVKYVRTV